MCQVEKEWAGWGCMMDSRHIFGPVLSRRLGVSLGVDLVPFKTCSLDCVYCECGKTSCLTLDRKEYVPIGDVIAELQAYLKNKPDLDYVTFSGSGEPTLHTGINQVIDFIKEYYPQYRLAVLTNGTLLSRSDVRKQLGKADVVIPSLDAASEEVFKRINRPHDGITCSQMISGLGQFRKEYRGELRLEVFIVPGINDTEEELYALKKAISKVNPDSVELNSLDRPGAEPWVTAPAPEKMRAIADYFGSADIIAGIKCSANTIEFYGDREKKVMSTLMRRPCTTEELAKILNMRISEMSKLLQALCDNNVLECDQRNRGTFFRLKR